ncbi:MAG: 50S ribosomal protein L15 [Armatimonadetes bacterium]|nr:50S ribosomal protein L15 [Armatimonadota bacterium]
MKAAPGSRHRKKRVGRGHGCHVKTACRGSNGQNARSGGGKGPGFEGGQTPWYRRLPKYRGFNNPNKVYFQLVSLDDLERFENGETVTPEALIERGVSSRSNRPFKVVANGRLTKKLSVKLHGFTQAARAAIEQAGGDVEDLMHPADTAAAE